MGLLNLMKSQMIQNPEATSTALLSVDRIPQAKCAANLSWGLMSC